MNEKKRNIILLTCVIIAYIAMIVLFIISVARINSFSYEAQKKYLEDTQVSIDEVFQTSTQENLFENLEKVVNEYPMEIVVEYQKNPVFTTIGARKNELLDKAKNEEVVLSHVQHSYKIKDEQYTVTYNLFHMKSEKYLSEISKTQTIIIFIAMIILLAFLTIVQYVLYQSLKNVKDNLSSLEEYELDKVLRAEATDDVNEKVLHVASNINKNMEHLSSEFTDLEKALQIEKEKLENAQMVSRAFVHDLKTPLHQTLVENEMVLKYTDELTEEMKVILNYNVHQTSHILNTINEILEMMENKKYDANKTEKINIVEMVTQSRKHFSGTLRKKDLYLTFDIPDKLEVESNPTTLRLLIYNVLSNAIQYAIEDSEILVALYQTDDNGIIFTCTNEATALNIERMQDGAQLFKKVPVENEFSSGNGLLLIRELTKTLNGEYNLEIDDHSVTVEITL